MKVFIINLERSLDRKEHIQKQIQKLFEKNLSLKNKLEFIFFKAIDAKNKEHLEFKDHFPWWGSWVLGRELSDGEKACFASHYKLWQECVKLDEPIIILEDDVEFSDEFLNNGAEYIDELLKSKYEYIRLCYLFDKRLYFLSEGGYYLSFKKLAGTQGYVLQVSAAMKFLKYAKNWIYAVDDYMDMFYKHNVLNIVKKPLLLKHDCRIESSISQAGRLFLKAKFYRKIIREIFRIYRNILKLSYTFYIKKKLDIS
ncbi:TPA: glycosyltransferase family 25 protein [Campylobacter jejuni]|uniref:glycosyltransferase family 25 protein n=1 Tax=Campylobacter jejuni TaxID=197 RepID=UPI0005C3FE90|nr:glycosyltransferase family 25 protein [Campylobacter jejuni]AJP35586.1 Glycosyltransferase family 25 (LPS biosynthesis protein) [Campylobacter jejuni subsp. jejuni]AQX69529.1 lipooligosaccharide biosynthesis glycosyltransferase [Campylobacter jejuni]AQY74934.1 lipooligosaccharide biosynthesis glycosyltransferase [Campylobacter jejuni subsp. jejuni]AWB37477.1 glycosyltransferase, family 25 [Campylobacter jejuni]ECO2975958.1 glycosyltransferase family 25 protein [Campylobacter jejuni]